MSKILKLNIQTEFQKCKSMMELHCVEYKYKDAFQNSVDASEFNRMMKEQKMRIKML